MNQVLKGKVAIVTGSGQGIGREIAFCMARQGAKVITNDLKHGSSLNAFEGDDLPFTEEERKVLQAIAGDAQTTANEIIRMGGEAVPVFGDVGSMETAERMVRTAIDTYGRVDIVVNNAASYWVGSIMKMDETQWDVNIVSKLRGTFNLMHCALPYMKEQKYGRILNAASDAFQGLQGMAAYGAANAGVVALSKAAAKDVAKYGITVNAYTPLAKTRSWYNTLVKYRVQGVPQEAIEVGAPAAMKNTADIMVPFLAYLSSDMAGDISGILFRLAADGTIGVWSDSEITREIQKDNGAWTMEELADMVPNRLMKDVTTVQTNIPLK